MRLPTPTIATGPVLRYHKGMEHYLLDPLYSLVAKERPQDPDELSAANVVGLRLLTGPYLGRSYQSWGLAQPESGHWCLCQEWDDEVIARDVLEPFYPAMFGFDEEEAPRYVVHPPRQTRALRQLEKGEDHVPAAIRARADAMLERLQALYPQAVGQLLHPTAEQLAHRQEIVIEAVEGRHFSERLRPILGDWADWSLRSYGIKYHSPTYSSSKEVFLLAHNGSEVCGVMKLGMSRPWAYVVSFISVTPGFRNQGLSLKLYQAAIEKCMADGKVLIRTEPGEGTPVQATLAYDRLVRGAPILHAISHGPLEYPLQEMFNKGWSYAQLRDQLKSVCDEALPSPQERTGERPGLSDWERGSLLQEKHGERIKKLMAGPSTAPTRKAGMKP